MVNFCNANTSDAIIQTMPAMPTTPKPGITNTSTASSTTPTAKSSTSISVARPTMYLLRKRMAKHEIATISGGPKPGVLKAM